MIGDPRVFGATAESFHEHCRQRLTRWPGSLNATSTHDTKRGEDARARINALSEIAPQWSAALMRWRKVNEAKKSLVDGDLAPDRNDEYLLYQTLVGAWPSGSLDLEGWAAFRERIAAYMQKAIKEAKVHTSWVNPNEAYDRAVDKFVREVLVPENSNGFLDDFSRFQQRLGFAGMVNSLAQTLLKMTAPGVPDFYQGTELWDLSLVDPDNRQPVDFVRRETLLTDLRRREQSGEAALFAELLSSWPDGQVKLYLIYKVLNFRREQRELFQTGDYLPLFTDGKFREHICAFARRLDDRWVITAAPRLWMRIAASGCLPLGASMWQEERLALPAKAPALWRNILTGETLTALETRADRKALLLREVFASIPVAFLDGEPLSG